MSQERLESVDTDELLPDSLFFYQLVLPVHQIDNKKENVSPIKDDPRQSFYVPVSSWSNLYAVGELELGSGYGHQYRNVTADELLRWDGVLVMDGVRGGSDGAILRRFDKRESNTAYDETIDSAFTKSRWLEIKRVVKKRGEEGYDPAYKYDYVFNTVVHNTNCLTLYASLDLVGDESSYAHQGHGETDTGLVSLIRNKPSVSKGMQTVIVSDVEYIRPRAYLHRHRMNKKFDGLSYEGPNEVRLIWEEQLSQLLKPDNTLIGRAIFSQKPHITWDNYFSGQPIMEYAAEQGFGVTSTISRDHLPRGVPTKYWCKAKTATTKRSKHARYENPIFAVKRIGQSVATVTSFQSTSSCNIASVNALNECSRYCATKERGRRQHKRRWGIEMNEARELYLKTYGTIDKMDHLIKNCNMKYRYVSIN